MTRKKNTVDKVRASRDGHEFHEAWTARKALQLLFPKNNLIGIAVEGLHPADQAKAKLETTEIADIVLYYGKYSTFKSADSVNIVQVKYSISSSNEEFRNSHAKKTIKKFAVAYLDYKKRYGVKDVQQKLNFELITNRPIYPAFKKAIKNIAEGKALIGEIKKQADQFKIASDLKGAELIEFARKVEVTGLAGTLLKNKRDLFQGLVDWSAARDSLAIVRLEGLKQLVRDKAGFLGQNNNVIRRTDILEALDIPDEDALFPCPPSFPKVGALVKREQMDNVVKIISTLNKPLLIHSAGGVGKTVFLRSLGKVISDNHKTILFDCFGGGIYRSPVDSRHLPKRGLVHIVNILACQGLCDPLLPNNEYLADLIKGFRKRLTQSVETLKRVSPDTELVLFIDAIDNAAQHANDQNEKSFPTVLLKSFHYGGHIPGVKLVVTCRSHRRNISKDDVDCVEFELNPFSLAETETYLRERLKSLTQTEIQVAQARSGGNGRVLEHLVNSNRGLLDQSEIDKPIVLDKLLTKRIDNALSDARNYGYKTSDIESFLAGLAILPPPIPLDEYANAHNMDISAIKSFAADLAPLLEHTKHGLMFRDELTETLIREKYGSNLGALNSFAKNLLKRQDISVYAAQTLPGLLQILNNGQELFNLAFDKRFPKSTTSLIGKQNIRYSRLKAAVLYATHTQNNKQLVHLLVELSMLASVDHRGTDYIFNYPDLVVIAKDMDATRRLFEARTSWPGTRHARLTIANTLSNDLGEAYRHAKKADDWISHYYEKEQKIDFNNDRPKKLDIAAIPFCLILQKRNKEAVSYMRSWKDWYGYKVSQYLFQLLTIANSMISEHGDRIKEFLESLTNEIGVIAAALSFLEISNIRRKELIKKLMQACKKTKQIEKDNNINYKKRCHLQDGLLKAAAIAVSLGLNKDALSILKLISQKRPNIWCFDDHDMDKNVFSFLTQTILSSVVKKTELRERDIYPSELIKLCSEFKTTQDDSIFRKKLLEKLEILIQPKQGQSQEDAKHISYEKKQSIKDFINQKIDPLFKLSQIFLKVLTSPLNKADKEFLNLLDAWEESSKKAYHYGPIEKCNRFFQLLGIEIFIFVLSVRNDLKVLTIKKFLKKLHQQERLRTSTFIEIVQILAKRTISHQLAGEEAVLAASLIEQEDEVTYSAELYAQLGRAIAPASNTEATEYFKTGLDQMDAIGSGDHEFTDELLLFASSLKGIELAEKDFHTLTNICELNMSEPDKFSWFVFARGLSKVSGCRGLAKVSRWDDRNVISLDYTLLPYLTALIDDDKIDPEVALSLMRLTNPVELYSCDTATFAKAIEKKNYPNKKELLSELILQFEQNNPKMSMSSIIDTLANMSKRLLGNKSKTAKYLSAAYHYATRLNNEFNENANYRGKIDSQLLQKQRIKNEDKKNKAKLRDLADKTIPNDERSMVNAIVELNEMRYIYNLWGEFFEKSRKKLAFSNRHQYIEIISHLENLNLSIKLDELERCKKKWNKSSFGLNSVYKKIAIPILQLHTEDFISFSRLSGSKLKQVEDISGISIDVLALELIKIFASPDWNVSPSVWLGAASLICDRVDEGEGQAALSRLLNSGSAKLASSVIDGGWKNGLYPLDDQMEIAVGLVWRMLGAPQAVDRWRAAHAVRCFAKFNRWDVIDALVERIQEKQAFSFQASELTFYYLHARLWLLIALARMAKDYPSKISKHYAILEKIVLDKKSPHVLIRHFASQTILTCVGKGIIKLSLEQKKQIRDINVSSFPLLKAKLNAGYSSFYHGRPKDAPKEKYRFSLDYDFEKCDVQQLSNIFGKAHWEVKDLMTKEIRKYDKKITSMYDSGGRNLSDRNSLCRMTSEIHSYGQQLGWHSLFLVAGKLLSKYPIKEDSYEDNPWDNFLNRELLTRKDGLWVSDCMDQTPLDVKINLLEQTEKGLSLTGDKSKLLRLIGIKGTNIKELIVNGNWKSPDDIKVHISSVLVSSKKSKAVIKTLIDEEPCLVWLPSYDDCEGEYLRNDKEYCHSWIACSSSETRLDENDPLGSISSIWRPYFAKHIRDNFSLKSIDSFNRIWKNSLGKKIAYSEAWRYEGRYEDNNYCPCRRLICSGHLLKEVLTKQNADLLLLIKLERYEKGIGFSDSKFSNTVAVIRINKTLNFEFFKGAINKLYQSIF